MAKGDKPIMSISYKRKDSPKGTKSTSLAGIWAGNFPNQHNLSFPKGTQMRLPDGRIINCDDFWWSVWVNQVEPRADDWGPSSSSSDPWGDPPASASPPPAATSTSPVQGELLPVPPPPDEDIPF